MGVAIPQIITEDRASGALVVDGSLRFDSGKSQHLKRTPSSVGNRTTWTWSGWIKRSKLGDTQRIFTGANATDDENWTALLFNSSNNFSIGAYNAILRTSNAVYRDVNAWMHILVIADLSNASNLLKFRAWVNNQEVTWSSTSTNQSTSGINAANNHTIGAEQSPNNGGVGSYSDIQATNIYFIDGQALDPSYFGYTDALTNTWRPKKLSSSVAFGTNGFYLPFDGSAPIGQDQSGRGNNWTPVNFGGSNTIEKATGALPILNTDGGGKVARVGVRTDSSASSLVLALPFVGGKDDVSNAVNSGSTTKAITNTSVTFTSSYSNLYDGSSSFNGTSSKLTTTATSDFLFGTGDFTVEGWFYLTTSRDYPFILEIGAHAGADGIAFMVNDRTYGTCLYSGGFYGHATVFSQLNKWNHIAWVRRSGVLYIYENGVLGVSAAFTNNLTNTTNNVIIGTTHSGASNYFYQGYIQDYRIYKGLAKYTQNFIPASTDPDILPDTPSGVSYTSNLTQITDGSVALDGSGDYLSLGYSADIDLSGSGTNFTVEAFIYKTSAEEDQIVEFRGGGSTGWTLYAKTNNTLEIYDSGAGGQSASSGTITLNVWNHIALTKNGSGSNNCTYWINGVSAGTFTLASFTATDSTGLRIGASKDTGAFLTGFISNLHIVKGTALYTANFTPPTAGISSVANTKLLCCKSNSSATAFDVSPGTITANGNAAATNFNPFTVNINTQRGKQSGWCTWNPLDTAGSTLSNGNLNITTPSSGLGATRGTIGVSSGKWYYEHMIISGATAIGIMKLTDTLVSGSGIIGASAGGYSYYSEGVSAGYNKKINNGTQTDYGTNFDPGDTISIAFDLDAGTITFYKNGVSQGVAFSGLSGTFSAAISDGTNGGSIVGATNFGQKPFKFPPPAGFQPLALANTPRPTIVRPDQYVGVTTYTGTGAARSINTGFKPDFVWIKDRSNGYNHVLFDSVRGTGGSKVLFSNRTTAEGGGTGEEGTVYGHVSSFDTSGFSVSPGSGSPLWVSSSGDNYVAWAWKAGGNSNTFNINDVGYATASAAGLTAGTITPTGASVNTKSGFSIIKYRTSGSGTVAHGLTQAPQVSIAKRMNGTGGWYFRVNIGSINGYLFLNGTDALTGSFSVTSTTVQGADFGSANEDWILYNWHDVPGFSKFGSYTGNASTDGPMIVTGFKPKLLIFKRTDTTLDWVIRDTERDKYNGIGYELYPDLGNAEGGPYTSPPIVDWLSNGFKLRSNTATASNGSGPIIYMAFAETPTQNLYGAQSNAR
jgi:hypothetical protein